VENEKGHPIVQFKWTESGGPPATTTSQPGFGSRLIAALIEGDLHGRIDARMEEDGLRFVAIFPLQGLSDYSSEVPAPEQKHALSSLRL
jgi:two-component sensor histidine kinase